MYNSFIERDYHIAKGLSHHFVIFIVNFEHISHLFLVFSLLIILAGGFLSSDIDRKKTKRKQNHINNKRLKAEIICLIIRDSILIITLLRIKSILWLMVKWENQHLEKIRKKKDAEM